MEKPTSKRHFDIFKAEFLKWQKEFGLLSWKITFVHGKAEPSARATIYFDVRSRQATVVLADMWEYEIGHDFEFEVRQTAFHEAMELFVQRMVSMADGRISNNRNAVEEEAHAIIRTLECVVFRRGNKKPI